MRVFKEKAWYIIKSVTVRFVLTIQESRKFRTVGQNKATVMTHVCVLHTREALAISADASVWSIHKSGVFSVARSIDWACESL